MAARRRPLVDPGALVTSVLLHAALLGAGALLLARGLADSSPAADAARAPAVDVTIEPSPLELPAMSAHGIAGAPDPEATPRPEPVALGGGRAIPRPDQDRAGRGGSAETREAALNLADSDDGLTLNRDPINRIDRSQVQRLDTAKERKSRDDRRATPTPMELDFLATGAGRRAERRPVAARDPSAGVLVGVAPSSLGGDLGGPAPGEAGLGPEPKEGAQEVGTDRKRAAAGVSDGARGNDVRRSAAVALARPWVPQGRAAVPAAVRGRPNDTKDSSQEVASAVRSLLHASTAGGKLGAGPGGSAGPGAPASGGANGPGSRSAPSGDGNGARRDSRGDPGLVGYFRGIEKKVEPHWRDAFPDWAIAEGRGGLTILALTLRRDGTLGRVSVVRPSGVPEFDRNVTAAVQRAAPFGPLPPALGPGPLTVHMSFDAVNPAVGRDGPGRGGRSVRNAP